VTGPDLTPEIHAVALWYGAADDWPTFRDYVVRMLADADRQGAARVRAVVEAVHGEAGPEGSSWCAADNKDWPCPTVQALAQAATPTDQP
jgi:hypothetical protein